METVSSWKYTEGACVTVLWGTSPFCNTRGNTIKAAAASTIATADMIKIIFNRFLCFASNFGVLLVFYCISFIYYQRCFDFVLFESANKLYQNSNYKKPSVWKILSVSGILQIVAFFV